VPFPVSGARIDEEEERVGRRLPLALRDRLIAANGGELFIGDEEWTLFPVWDPTSKRSAARSSGHIARETAALYEALADVLSPGLVALAENGSGDYLMIDASSITLIWRHETNDLESVEVEWDRKRPVARARSHRAEAIDRVANGLASVGAGSDAAVVVEAPETGVYVQFASVSQGIVGEAVGESNLSRLLAFRMGPSMQAELPRLGWRPPADPAIDHGNWTQSWSSPAWDPQSVARLVVRTFSQVYGLEPWALVVSGSSSWRR
jgi:hypothetical protein